MLKISEKSSRSRAFVLLRYTLIIAIAYLMLSEHGVSEPPASLILLVIAALASNVVMGRLPARITDTTAFNAGIILVDTVWITAALLYSGYFGPDFFYVYFFVLLLAAIGENLSLIAIGAIIASTAYVYILSNATPTMSLWTPSSLIRIPFLFTAAAFYGYLVDRVRREQQRARVEAETVARLEHEISERKRVEDDLKAAKDYAQNLINSSLDIIVSTDVNRNIVEFNQAAEHAFGYGKAEVSGKPIDLLYADPSEGARVFAAGSKHHQFIGTIRNKRKNGEIFSSFLAASVIRDVNGAVIGGVGISRDITERKRAEEALRESEERFRTLSSHAPVGIFLADPQGDAVFVNDRVCEMADRPPEQFLGKNWSVAIHPEDRGRIEKEWAHVTKGGNEFSHEFRFLTPQGKVTWLQSRAMTLRNAAGEITGHLGTLTDITDRKGAEAALRESVERYRTLFEHAPIGLGVADAEGNLLAFNTAMLAPGGYTPEDIARIRNVVHLYEDQNERAKVLQIAEKQGFLHQQEVRFKRKDGSAYDALLSLTPVSVDGRRSWQAMVQDITQRKRAEEELRETRSYLARLIENSTDAIISTNKEGNVMLFNKGAEALLGYQHAEIIGQRVSVVYESEERAKDVMRQMRQHGGTVTGFETTLRAKNGTLIPVLISASILLDAEGQEAGTVGFSKDLRERKQAEEALRVQTSELAAHTERLEALVSLSSAVSATLNTKEVFSLIVETVVRLLDAALARVWIVEEESGDLVRQASAGDTDLIDYPRLRFRPGEGMVGSALLGKETISIIRPAEDPRYLHTGWAKAKGIKAVAAIPLMVGDRALGVLSAVRRIEKPFSPEDLRLLTLFANQAAIAVENARLFQETGTRAEKLRVLAELSRTITATLDPQQVFDSIIQASSELLAGPIVSLWTLEGKELCLRASLGLQSHLRSHRRFRPGEGMVGWIAQEKQTVVVPEFAEDPRVKNRAWAVAEGLHAFAGTPLLVGNRSVGVLAVVRKSSRPFGTDEVQLLTALANQATIAIQNARLFQDIRQKAERLQVLNRLSRIVASALDPQQVVNAVVQAAAGLFEDSAINLWITQEDGNTVDLAAHVSRHPDLKTCRQVPIGEGLAGWIAKEKRPLLIADIQNDPKAKNIDWLAAEDFHAFMGAPLLLGEKCLGSLNVFRRSLKTFDLEERDVLSALAHQAAIALENARLFDQVAQGKREWEGTFNAISDGIVLLDEQGAVLQANHAFGSWWSTPTELLIGASWHDLWTRTGISSACPHCEVWRVKGSVSTEAHLPASKQTLAFAAFPLQPRPSEPLVGVILVIRDVTRRKQAEEELKTTQLQLMQSAKFESVGQLAAGVAHEVKNPLAIVLQGLTYLSNAVSKTDDGHIALVLEKMDNAVRRADQVIKGVLDFSAPSRADVTATELNAVVDQSLLLVNHELVKGGVTVVKELEERLPLMKLDPQKIQQVFVNLFMNAIQAMPEGGTLTIKTGMRQPAKVSHDVGRPQTNQFETGETLLVAEIQDTGTGIPDDKLDRLFDPFFTTKPPGQGTGLGLSVTRKIIDLHGGTIDITNRPEGGVRVTLTFTTEGGNSDAEETDSTH